MDGQNQQPPTQSILTPPQTIAPLALALSATRSINMAHVARYEPVEFFKLDDKGKITNVVDRVAPCVYFVGDGEPVELSREENEVFRRHWNVFQKNTAFQMQLLYAVLPPDAPPASAALMPAIQP